MEKLQNCQHEWKEYFVPTPYSALLVGVEVIGLTAWICEECGKISWVNPR